MSGLQDYYNSVSAYSSNADSVNSFLSNYDDTFYSNFNDKVNEVKEQGKALIEAGGAVEGVYVGFKGVQKGVQAWRSKYGKKSGGDGDETGGGDDSNAGGGTEGETSGGLEEAGFTEEDAAGLFPDEAAPAGGGGGVPAGGGGDPDPIEGADPDAPFPDAPEVPVDFGGGTGHQRRRSSRGGGYHVTERVVGKVQFSIHVEEKIRNLELRDLRDSGYNGCRGHDRCGSGSSGLIGIVCARGREKLGRGLRWTQK